ncbi:endonuclease V [Ramicandelaber brevisporus]|nr:endonuclease V [Ramicandelaber brevisporus]
MDIQLTLRSKLKKHDDGLTFTATYDQLQQTPAIDGLTLVGGVDISFFIGESDNRAVATLVVLSYPDLEVVYEDLSGDDAADNGSGVVHLELPYIPSFLAFREVPHLIKLVDRLRQKRPDLMPQVILVDGNGILHPRQFGLASHLGVVANVPTIGVSKNFFQMEDIEPGMTIASTKSTFREAVAAKRAISKNADTEVRTYGAAVAFGKAVSNPTFVTIGHRVSLETAIAVVKAMSLHRVPEPIRQADLRSRRRVAEIESKEAPSVTTSSDQI